MWSLALCVIAGAAPGGLQGTAPVEIRDPAVELEKAVAAVEPVVPAVAAVPETPLVLEEEAEVSWTRWLWWLLIVYMFYAQATICDEYFVESIKVVVETYGIPDDVAGATLMALGCNGPELFTNFIAIFVTHSDVGVGTIVGSEIFNILGIVGGAIVFSPVTPMTVKKVPFCRDCAFYAVSIAMLMWVLWDATVTFFEASCLFAGCVCYALVVSFTAKAVQALGLEDHDDIAEEHADHLKPDEVAIHTEVDNRMMARKSILEVAKISVASGGLVIEDADMPKIPKSGPSKRRSIIGGARNSREIQGLEAPLLDDGKDELDYKQIVAVHDMGDNTLQVEVKAAYGETMTVTMEAGSAAKKAELMASVSTHVQGGATKVMVGSERVLSEFSHSMNNPDMPVWRKAACVVTVPVEFIIGATCGWCDVRDPAKRDKWAAGFGMSMLWLAVFSYIMCSAADGLHDGFGISQAVLGVTICAFGTSFPNFWASVLMAKANRADMAVSNALGSNVQNVFLALSVPWLIKTGRDGDFAVAADGIFGGVIWMAGTEAVVFAMAIAGNFSFGLTGGYILFATYFCYLIYATVLS